MQAVAAPARPSLGDVHFRRSRSLNVTAFTVGCLSFLYVEVVGQLYIVEILAPALLLVLWPRKHHLLLQKPARTILLLGLIWLTGQIVTDLYRGTPWEDLARGWATIGIFLILFAVLHQLVSGDIRRVYWLLFGAAVGGLLQQFFQPSHFFEAEPWKFGFGPPLALLLIACAGKNYWKTQRFQIRWIVGLLAFGTLSFYLNARSLGGFVILTALFAWGRTTRWGRRLAARRPSFGRLVLVGCCGLVLAAAVLKSYELAVTRGWLGESALQKYEMQASGKLGLIIGGRVEVIPAMFAVMHSPLIGHGSWAKDPRYRDYLWLLQDLGYEYSDAQLDMTIEKSDLIPCHSHILQAWVWAGVLGAVFWASAFILLVLVLIRTFQHPHPLFVPVIFLGAWDLWNILFSPFGSMMRFHWAMTLTVYLTALMLMRHSRALGQLELRPVNLP